MPDTGSLHQALIAELRNAYDAEKQLVKALPKLAKAAGSPELKAAFTSHLAQTRGHVERLVQAFETLNETVRGKHCDGIAGIIEEGASVLDEDFDASTMDACLIASGQRAEHYEIAAYGVMVAWARVMGHTEAANLLQQNLDEEREADAKLTALAEGGINQRAAQGRDVDEDDTEGPADTAPRRRAPAGKVTRPADHAPRPHR